jgi:hypothetical protein
MNFSISNHCCSIGQASWTPFTVSLIVVGAKRRTTKGGESPVLADFRSQCHLKIVVAKILEARNESTKVLHSGIPSETRRAVVKSTHNDWTSPYVTLLT